MDNGMELMLDAEVTAIERTATGYRVHAGDRFLETRMVINCAGLCSDRIHNMVAEPAFRIIYRRGSISCWTAAKASSSAR